MACRSILVSPGCTDGLHAPKFAFRRHEQQRYEEAGEERHGDELRTLGKEEPFEILLLPGFLSILGDGFFHDALLEIAKLAGGGVGFLLDRGEKKRIESRIFLLDLLCDPAVSGRQPPGPDPNAPCPNERRSQQKRRREWMPPASERVKQQEQDTSGRSATPTERKTAPKLETTIGLRDRLEMRQEDRLSHNFARTN